MRTTVPGPLARLGRSRLGVAAVLALAVFAAGTGYMRDTAAVQLQGAVDANWRGAFDLLVRPFGQRLDLEETAGLVEPNYLAFSGDGGITLDDLTAIRAIPSVELAAPVAVIGNLRYVVGGPVVARGDLPERPTLYRITVRAETSDGLQDILVQEQTARVLLGPEGSSPEAMPIATDIRSVSCCTDGMYLYLDALPAISSPIIGVDPSAERQLLGQAADFLAPLEEFAAWPSQPLARDFDAMRIPEAFADQRFLLTLLTADPSSPAAQRAVVPVAVSSTVYASLSLTLEVEQLGEPLADFPAGGTVDEQLAQAAELAGEGSRVLGSSTLDAGAVLRPFQVPQLMLEWPNADPPTSSSSLVGVAADLAAELAARPRYDPIAARDGTGRPSFVVTAEGWVDSSGAPQPTPTGVGQDGLRIGVEPAFRESRQASLPLLDGFVPSSELDRPFAFAPVAEFDLGLLNLPDNPLNYVPLGAYAAPETWYVADADGQAVEPIPMRPTLNPLGLITLPPLAITDLRSAATLRGPAPIDAIRVRVAGIDRFDEAAVRRVEQVASAISTMGFDVDIVAGSSPQTVEVRIDEQAPDGSPRSVRWAEQEWTTLGAAERVVEGFSATNRVLLALSGLTAVALAAGMIVLQRAVRATEIGILRAIGWSRRRIVGWIVGEAVWAGAIVLLIGLAAWWAAGRASTVGPLASVALAMVFPIVAGISSWSGLRNLVALSATRSGDVDRTAAGLVRVVRSPTTYGLRTALARPSRTLVIGLVLGIAAGAAAAGAAVLVSTAAAVGPTRLADALVQVLTPIQAAMLLAAVAASGLIGLALLRMDLVSRRDEMQVLSASGWDQRHKRAMLMTHRLAIGAPAALVALSLGWLLTLGLLGAGQLATAAIAPAAVVAALVVEARWSAG